MRVRTETGRIASLNKQLLDSLERLRLGLGIDARLWTDITATNPGEYARCVREGTPVSLRSVEALANYLDLSLELILDGAIDYPALIARLRGDLTVLPDRYASGSLSSNRTVINLLVYLEQRYGWRTLKTLLRRLQVHEAAFHDSTGKVSIHFQGDLCDQLMHRGFTPDDLRKMGAYSAVTNKESPIGRILVRARDVSELYALMIEEASSLYDRNFDYSILNLDGNGCLIKALPSELARDSLGTDTPGSLGACATRSGVFESAASYIDAVHSHVYEIRCVHRGDPACEYLVEYA